METDEITVVSLRMPNMSLHESISCFSVILLYTLPVVKSRSPIIHWMMMMYGQLPCHWNIIYYGVRLCSKCIYWLILISQYTLCISKNA